jgi:hypothetical protein
MIAGRDIPRLHPRAKLRVDARTGDTFLLYPERGLRLNGTAAEILSLACAGQDLDGIVRIMSDRYGREPTGMRADILGFLEALAARGLLAGAGAR